MKILSTLLFATLAIFCMGQIGSADRLYHWIDSQGVSHISKEPPSEANRIDIMEYSVSGKTPEETVQGQSGKTPEAQEEKKNIEEMQETIAQPKPKNDFATACYFQAAKQDVYVYVTEDRRPGGSSYKNTLWKGDILSGQKILIESSRGKINYSYQRSTDDRSYGDNQAECVNGNVITIE